jgi:Fur family transcriptional regulator, ferric uptake regulator
MFSQFMRIILPRFAGRKDEKRKIFNCCSLDVENSLLHRREKENFLDLIKQTGEDFSSESNQVFSLFMKIDGHISPEYLRRKVLETGKSIELNTVLESLELFCRYGLAQKAKFNGVGVVYEHLHPGSHHDHLLCNHCGKIVEFFDQGLEAIQKMVVKKNGFAPLKHRLYIYGICPQCQEKRKSTGVLSEALSGEILKISGIDGGQGLETRLRTMGLKIGDIVSVVNNSGPIIITIDKNRLALGRGMAEKILTIPVES